MAFRRPNARKRRSGRLRPTNKSRCWREGTRAASSDFYSYRYLATEGFLPGYNFPRLPIYAFVPAGGYRRAKAAYLQRARFLAIAEFGPGSLIYHEGRAYRVCKARVARRLAHARRADSSRPASMSATTAERRTQTSPSVAWPARSRWAHVSPIPNVLRIDNVETKPAERITANDEDRQRRGFEIQTVFAWPIRDGLPDVELRSRRTPTDACLTIDYASGAKISRINKGLRRRKEK